MLDEGSGPCTNAYTKEKRGPRIFNIYVPNIF
ncbi:Hypothetical protein SRM_00318 [Salinibacter ruber M8]|uniref:Uncharacterized protein n=1 Tax=Salinibacter ruber (strain M8) TaxID=761659 RepID=D5H5D4_SALRM|nr:Hypothetical protein SRM_00318 [Salinibacter ruber M8]